MALSTTENKIFKCITTSTSAAEAAEKFISPQRGRPVKDLEIELESLINKYSKNVKGHAVVETAKIILEKMNSNNLPQFNSPPKEEEIVVKDIGDYYVIIKDSKIYRHSKKQIKFFRDVLELIDKHAPK
jgi:hypothetical protein